jgi:hypothetical protein
MPNYITPVQMNQSKFNAKIETNYLPAKFHLPLPGSNESAKFGGLAHPEMVTIGNAKVRAEISILGA